ncbi:MAG: hypothetical protein PHE49_09570 [bacterium]|nr:hypothetical protein [bacterium]
MKKIIFILFVVFALTLFSGCTFERESAINSTNEPKDNNTQDIFEMKAKCPTYREEIIKIMEETSWAEYSIDEIFYSPIRNSCLYAVLANQRSYSAYIIWDYFTGEMLLYRDTTLTYDQDLSDIYRNAKQYLKGEGELKYTKKDWNTDSEE